MFSALRASRTSAQHVIDLIRIFGESTSLGQLVAAGVYVLHSKRVYAVVGFVRGRPTLAG